MIAAIYARKSTEQNGVADEARSVTRQVEHAKEFADRKGWAVDEHFIFIDDGISGAEFAKRPAFLRLMASLKPKPSFGVLVMSEESRLGREMVETMGALKQLVVAGVRVFYYLEDKERTLNSPMEKAMMALETFGAELEREKTRQRVTDGMLRKARLGHCCGGRVFGYDNVEVLGADGRRSHVERRINEQEAVIVRRIFRLCAEGKGVKGIAKLLNADRLPSPRPKLNRPQAWAPSSVRSVLYNDLYRGVQVWNKRNDSGTWGQRSRKMRAPEDWVRVDLPQLRVVTDGDWNAAHKRLQSAAAVYWRNADGRLGGRPPSGIESKYLLSGLGQCALCNASMTVRASHGRCFICANYDHRGSTVCANNVRLPMAAADAAVLAKARDYILAPEIVEGAIVDAIRELRPSRDTVELKRAALGADLRQVEEEQARYVAAIAAAGRIEVLTRALQDSERKRARLVQELAALHGLEQLSTFDVRAVERDLRKRVDEWRGLLRRQTPLARQVLGKLLDGRLVWTPKPNEGLYEFSGRVRYGKLLSGIVLTRSMVAVRGFEPRSRG